MFGDAAAYVTKDARPSAAEPQLAAHDLGIMKYLIFDGFPFTCTLHGGFLDCATTYALTSYATEGDLSSWVERAGGADCVYESQAKHILIQVAQAVRWLRELDIRQKGGIEGWAFPQHLCAWILAAQRSPCPPLLLSEP